MMCVKLTLAPLVRASWLLRMSRLTSSSRAGMVRTLVAVGTPRLASMLATIREAAPRRMTASSVPASTDPEGAGAVVADGVVGTVAVVAGGGTGAGGTGGAGASGWAAGQAVRGTAAWPGVCGT